MKKISAVSQFKMLNHTYDVFSLKRHCAVLRKVVSSATSVLVRG